MEKDESIHLKECKFFKELKDEMFLELTEYEQDYCWLLIRCLISRFQDLKKFQDEYWKLCSNLSGFPNERMEREIRKVMKVLKRFYQEYLLDSSSFIDKDIEKDIDEKWLIDLICKEECNSFGLYTFDYKGNQVAKESYGLALFLEAVYFNHSCIPNIGHVTRKFEDSNSISNDQQLQVEKRNGENVFYALRDITKGEELCISYISINDDLYKDSEARKKKLKEIFFFDCSCKLCLSSISEWKEEIEEIVCNQKDCKGWYIPPLLSKDDKWQCEACNSNK
jgi:hypothetical protein